MAVRDIGTGHEEERLLMSRGVAYAVLNLRDFNANEDLALYTTPQEFLRSRR